MDDNKKYMYIYICIICNCMFNGIIYGIGSNSLTSKNLRMLSHRGVSQQHNIYIITVGVVRR